MGASSSKNVWGAIFERAMRNSVKTQKELFNMILQGKIDPLDSDSVREYVRNTYAGLSQGQQTAAHRKIWRKYAKSKRHMSEADALVLVKDSLAQCADFLDRLVDVTMKNAAATTKGMIKKIARRVGHPVDAKKLAEVDGRLAQVGKDMRAKLLDRIEYLQHRDREVLGRIWEASVDTSGRLSRRAFLENFPRATDEMVLEHLMAPSSMLVKMHSDSA